MLLIARPPPKYKVTFIEKTDTSMINGNNKTGNDVHGSLNTGEEEVHNV